MNPRISLPVAAILAAVISCVAPGSARADMEVYFQEDGTTPLFVGHTTAANDFKPAGDISFTGTVGDFSVTFFGSVAQNAKTLSDLMTSSTTVQNTDAAKSHKLTIYVAQSNFTLPPGPFLNMTSHIGGSVTTGGPGQSLTFQSYANATNADLASPVSAGDGAVTSATLAAAVASATGYPGQPGQPLTPGPHATTGPQTMDISKSPSSFDSEPDPSTLFTYTAGTMYSVTTINAITLAGNGNINFASTTTLTGVPAPAGLVLALTALPAMGVGGWLSRRRKRAAC